MNPNKKKPTTGARLPKRPRPQHSFEVVEGQAIGLLEYLTKVAFVEKSRTTIKQLLHDRFISVNGTPVTQWDYPLEVGNIVTLHPTPLPTALTHRYVEILWQDDYLVMIHKRAGIPTVASGEERDETALRVVSEHLKKFNPRAKVYLLNRIDKDSSGFVLMAKSEELQEEMINRWDKYIQRQQFAIVIEGKMPSEEGQLSAPEVTDEKRRPLRKVSGGLTAGEARYRVLQMTDLGSLLSISLERGRNNRLRRQLSELKRPIMGDWRNGSRRKDLGFVALEMTIFSFVHPITGKRIDFDQPIPGNFRRLLTDPAPDARPPRPKMIKK